MRAPPLLVTAFGLIVAASDLRAQAPPVPTPAATLEARGRIEGTVRDRDGTPIAGAEVTFTPGYFGGDVVTRSDSYGPTPAGKDGTFTLDAVPAGPGSIWVVPPPETCAVGRTLRCPFSKVVTVAESGTTTVSLVDPAVILTGRVFRSGRAEEGLKVSYSRTGLWPPDDRRFPTRTTPVTVETGPDGTYRLVLPHPGRARLRISTPDESAHFYKEVVVPSVATHVKDLRVGDPPPTPQVRAMPTRERKPAIEGRTIGRDGSPTSAFVRACAEDKPPVARYQTDSDLPNGKFSFRNLQKGRYTLVARGPDGSVAYLRGIDVGTSDVALALEPPAEVTLRLLDARGGPAAGAWVRIEAIDGASPCEVEPWPADGDGVATLRLPAATKTVDVRVYHGRAQLREVVPLEPGGRREVVLRLRAP